MAESRQEAPRQRLLRGGRHDHLVALGRVRVQAAQRIGDRGLRHVRDRVPVALERGRPAPTVSRVPSSSPSGRSDQEARQEQRSGRDQAEEIGRPAPEVERQQQAGGVPVRGAPGRGRRRRSGSPQGRQARRSPPACCGRARRRRPRRWGSPPDAGCRAAPTEVARLGRAAGPPRRPGGRRRRGARRRRWIAVSDSPWWWSPDAVRGETRVSPIQIRSAPAVAAEIASCRAMPGV